MTSKINPTSDFLSEKENGYKLAVQLAIRRFGSHDLSVAVALAELADFYTDCERHEEAASCDRRAGVILENWLELCGPNKSNKNEQIVMKVAVQPIFF